jgi:transglutaminase-like putative cysteine protease
MGDIGVLPSPDPMDISGWFEAYLGHRWYTFDARHNKPRVGRVPIAYGRDAGDVAITTTFGPNELTSFRVISDELPSFWGLSAFMMLIVPHWSIRMYSPANRRCKSAIA